MANELPINIVLAGALPMGFTGTPQQIAEAIVARLRLQSTQSFVLLAGGATAPSSNVGPWLKDDNQLWVWDNETGGYVPQTIDPSAFADGSIPQSKLAVGTITNTTPFRASAQGANQTIDTAVASFAYNNMAFPTENFDPDNVFDPVTGIFTAREAGFYFVSHFTQIDNNAADPGTAASMQISVYAADADTSANLGIGATSAVANPPGSRWFTHASGIIQLGALQRVRLRVEAIDGVGTGKVDISANSYWSAYQVRALQEA